MLDVLFMIIFVPLWGYLTYKIFNAYRKSHTMISDGPINELNGWFGVLISVGIIAGIILTIPCLIIMSLWKSHPIILGILIVAIIVIGYGYIQSKKTNNQ